MFSHLNASLASTLAVEVSDPTDNLRDAGDKIAGMPQWAFSLIGVLIMTIIVMKIFKNPVMRGILIGAIICGIAFLMFR